MTDCDPAGEAAQRATNGPVNGPVGAFALAAAREALVPIRKLIEHRLGVGACEVFLEDLLPLVYPESEMPND